MRLWTLVKLLVLIALLGFVGFLATKNVETLAEKFALSDEISVPVFAILIGAFVLGLMVSVVLIGIQEVELFFENLKRRRKEKKAANIEDLYFKGVEAIFDGREEEAVKAFYKLLDQSPGHTQTLIKLGEVLRKLGRHDEAIKIHQRALRDDPDNHRVLYDLATDYKAVNDKEKAREILERIISSKPRTSLNAQRCLRDIYIEEARWEKAIDIQKTIIKGVKTPAAQKDERDVLTSINYRRGAYLREQGDLKEAEKILKKTVKSEPAFVPGYLELGRVYLDRDDDDEAIKIWKEGLDKTGSTIFPSRIEKHYLDKEQPRNAIEVFKDIIAETEQEVVPRFLLGKLYLRLEMLDDAEFEFKGVMEKVEDSPTLKYFLAKISERKGDTETAARQYREVIKEMGVLNLQYVCRSCGANYAQWQDRCDNCSVWNSIEVDLTEEAPPEKPGGHPHGHFKTTS